MAFIRSLFSGPWLLLWGRGFKLMGRLSRFWLLAVSSSSLFPGSSWVLPACAGHCWAWVSQVYLWSESTVLGNGAISLVFLWP